MSFQADFDIDELATPMTTGLDSVFAFDCVRSAPARTSDNPDEGEHTIRRG
jgi:hypothetical protein